MNRRRSELKILARCISVCIRSRHTNFGLGLMDMTCRAQARSNASKRTFGPKAFCRAVSWPSPSERERISSSNMPA